MFNFLFTIRAVWKAVPSGTQTFIRSSFTAIDNPSKSLKGNAILLVVNKAIRPPLYVDSTIKTNNQNNDRKFWMDHDSGTYSVPAKDVAYDKKFPIRFLFSTLVCKTANCTPEAFSKFIKWTVYRNRRKYV